MQNWFEVKIKYEKTAEEGKIVKVTETYLVEALSVTEAEAKVIEDFKGYTMDFEVKSVSASKIIKIINTN